MATLTVDDTSVRVEFTRAEKLAGLLRDIEVPRSAVRSVVVEPDALAAVRGVRAPGFALPGRRKVGTWRGRGRRAAVSVQRDQPAVRVSLEGAGWTELLVGADDADAVAERLRQRAGRG